MSRQHPRNRSNRLYRPLAIAALMSAGILQPLLPVFAAGTAAGLTISNTATATYDDDADPNNGFFNATSNTVSIKVAEVGGLTATPAGLKDTNGGAIEAGDTLNYDFEVTNVGNAATDIFVPDAGQVGVQNFTATKVQVSIDGGTTFKDLDATNFPGQKVPNVAADGKIIVRVIGTVPTSGIVAGDAIKVTLGDVAPNDNTAATQNQPLTVATSPRKDLQTVNIGPDAPVNGEREASAFQQALFATQLKPLALAMIKKSVGSVAPGATSAGNDDVITYNLDVTVKSQSPSGAFTPAALEGTPIQLDSATVTKILVSDAVPAGTVLESAPIAPANWQVVYSTSPLATTIPVKSTASGALPAASWNTTAPTDLTTVTRVGYIYNGSGGTSTTVSPALPANGTAIPGFVMKVKTSGLPVNGGSVANLAQVFGQTSGDTSGTIVYDESGDNNANNFNDDQTPPNANGTAFDPTLDVGKADPATQGTDPLNNTGTGVKGEDTVTVITGTVAAASDQIYNGPDGTPLAVGPTDSNDDFTNKSTAVPPGQQAAFDPASIIFKNTVNNPSSTLVLPSVTVQPISPAQAEANDGIATTGQYGTDASIPLGTTVKITSTANTAKTATYTYQDVSGTKKFVLTAGAPVNLGDLAAGGSAGYTSEIDLPSGNPLTAVSIPIIAFPDNDPTNVGGKVGFDGELTNNITLDRVYMGYMKLFKEARILDAAGNVVVNWTDAASTSGLLSGQLQPGQFVEYRIQYQNISAPANGSGNVILNANGFKLVEKGNATVGSQLNSWGSSTLHQKNTSASKGSVTYFDSSSTTIGTTDPANGADVLSYENQVGNLLPGDTGSFQFRRKVK
jgi:hypothetical protein